MNPFSLGVRAIAEYNVLRHLNVRVEGLQYFPARGPVLLAARHYHHLYDGAALVHALPRQPHIFVALDWTRSRWGRLVMETACGLADWPVALRGENLGGTSAFRASEARRYVRRALAFGAELLQRGDVLAVFPEGFPTIDPAGSRKRGDDAFLPFRAGMLAIVRRAQQHGAAPVPILPAGLAYARRGRRYDVTLRLGAPVFLHAESPRANVLEQLRENVRALSV